jgi:hypothetical protein
MYFDQDRPCQVWVADEGAMAALELPVWEPRAGQTVQVQLGYIRLLL